jgi:hypothetical protein
VLGDKQEREVAEDVGHLGGGEKKKRSVLSVCVCVCVCKCVCV